MLAGYLPFDDDPANPEGDNINLLYKYIVNTPLTFPEYVTPHARDLLRRILVPNPRKRADLFEVARHSWLSEYAHVVEFITSSTTSPKDIQNTTVPAEDVGETPVIARSASVRESSKKTAVSPAIGGLVSKQGTIDPESEAAYTKQQRDNKRRTVQVEYVAPNTTTQRGEPPGTQPSSSRTRIPSGNADAGPSSAPREKSLPTEPPVTTDYGKTASTSRKPPSAHRNVNYSAAAVRPGRETAPFTTAVASSSGARPTTGGSMHSTGSRGPGGNKRNSYSQPVPPEVADTNVHGKIQQPPRAGSSYGIPSSASQGQQPSEYGRPSISVPPKFARLSGFAREGEAPATNGTQGSEHKGHKRSSTMGEISGKLFGRSGSLFGGRSKKRAEQGGEKGKNYPPVSMNYSLPGAGDEPRTSMDSKRSRKTFSMSLGKKASGSITGSQTSREKQPRRFSFIPGSFSLKAIGIGKDEPRPQLDSQQDLPIQEPPTVDQYGRYVDQNVGREQQVVDASTLDGMYAQLHEPRDPYGRQTQPQQQPQQQYQPQYQQQHQPQQQQYSSSTGYGRPTAALEGYMPQGMLSSSDASVDFNNNNNNSSSNGNIRRQPGSSAPQLSLDLNRQTQNRIGQQDGAAYDARRVASGGAAAGSGRSGRGVLQKNKRFVDAYGDAAAADPYARHSDHSGSSGPARKVMDFFRRRGKARGGEIA